MNCYSFKPSLYIERTRFSAAAMLIPGRVITETMVARLTAEISTSLEIAREYEEEVIGLLRKLMPPALPVPKPALPTGQVIPFRRPPDLRVLETPPDGGDAA